MIDIVAFYTFSMIKYKEMYTFSMIRNERARLIGCMAAIYCSHWRGRVLTWVHLVLTWGRRVVNKSIKCSFDSLRFLLFSA